jgi:intracellular multiplication protein IcmO
MTKREIVGPQERFERSGAQRLRDIRPITTRLWSGMMSEFSGLILAVGAMAMFVEPALLNLVAPGSLLYAGLVMSRRVTLSLRLPRPPASGTGTIPRQLAGALA